MLPAAFLTDTLRGHARGADVAAILHAGVAAVEPAAAVRRHLRRGIRNGRSSLVIGGEEYDLADWERVLLLAVGKAAVPMAHAALDIVGSHVQGGLVVPKAGADQPPLDIAPLTALPASHPVPDERSLEAGRRAFELLRSAGERDLVLTLLSGGGSALMTWPEDEVTLADMRALTDTLLASGATINEINALRRRCDRVKGGGLLDAATPATVAVLVLSDVIGDDLRAIASGPFVPDEEQVDIDAIVERYRLRERLPRRVVDLLQRTPTPAKAKPSRPASHTIIANVEAAVAGAMHEARDRGFEVDVLTTSLRGEAREVGAEMARRLIDSGGRTRPLCLIAGGETTVTLHGNGLGGRNQELALGAVPILAGHGDLMLVTLATDGGDGPTDAAGAVVTGDTLGRGQSLGLEPEAFLARNDAYHYWEALGDLLMPGPTETNVNDLLLLVAF